jgi:cell division protein ZapA
MPHYPHRIEIEIFGNTYKILGDEEPEYMKKISEYVDKKMKAITKKSDTVSTSKIAILAALHIADELFKLKELGEKKISLLINKVETSLKKIKEQK